MKTNIDALLARLYHPGLKAIDPGLDRVAAFLELLGSPHKHFPPVIHVAGTNGKGSVIAYLHAIFEAAGYRVHRYISPHLVRFNERIVIAGKMIEDAYLEELLERIYAQVEQQPVTFFEATTAAAFLAFAENQADIVLLETGMGGRLDATNVIDKPLLTVITPIGYDHCKFLGNTLAEIAGEKAGILKPGVPCIVGRQAPDALKTIEEKAKTLHAPLYRLGIEWQVDHGLKPALVGVHQLDNASTAAACIAQLQGFSISRGHIEQGIAAAIWPARLQRLNRDLPQGIELWLDGGHNPHGAAALAGWLSEQSDKQIHLICGMVKGKDTAGFLQILAPHITKLYAIAIPDEPLSQSAPQIEMAAQKAGITAQTASSIENALQTIAAHAKTPSIVCICGSLYLAGKVLAANEE